MCSSNSVFINKLHFYESDSSEGILLSTKIVTDDHAFYTYIYLIKVMRLSY